MIAPGQTRRFAWQNLIVLVIAIFGSVLVCELLVRWFVPVRNIGPRFSVYDPRFGKVLKKSFACTRFAPEFTMRFTTNSLGFRGPEPKEFPRRPILFLGDSFTSGYGVNDGEEFPELIRKGLETRFGPDTFPVVNAGSGNTGNAYWVKFLRSEGARFNPRLVVLQFCGNDFADNVEEGFFTLSPDASLVEHSPRAEEARLRSLQDIIEAIPGLSYSHLVALAAQAFAHEGRPPDSTAENSINVRLTQRIIDEAISGCERRGWPVIGLSASEENAGLDSVTVVFQRHHIPFVRIPDKTHMPELYYKVDGHWNAAGHAYAARKLLDVIVTSINTHKEDQ